MQVKLTYFQRGGKYYAEGEYETRCEYMWQIFNEVTEKANSRCLPGLVAGHSDFIVLVDVPHHPHNHPALIL